MKVAAPSHARRERLGRPTPSLRTRMAAQHRQPNIDPEAIRLITELRMVREEAGVSRKKVADRLGLSERTVARFEDGAAEPRISVLNAYAEALGLPPVTLRWSVRIPGEVDRPVDLPVGEWFGRWRGNAGGVK